MNKKGLSFLVVSLLLLAAIIFSALTGSIRVSLVELVQDLFYRQYGDVQVIKDLRLPRIIIAVFCGAALSVSGVLLQAVMRNPLAEPGIIVVSSGAGFVSLLMVGLFPTLFFYMPLFAFLGGALAFFLVYTFSWKSGLDPLRMILVGVAIHAVFTGLGQVVSFTGNPMSGITTSTLAMKTWGDVQ